MKIGILNVKYSANLGDGAIAECLESQIKSKIPDAEIVSIDIGGMDDYGSGGSIVGSRLGLTKKLKLLPASVQSAIKSTVMPFLVQRKYAKKWGDQLKGCDALIIGGGHLLMDVDLYFPSRIMTAVRSAPRGIPLFVHAVGVSKRWSERGRGFFEKAFSHGKICGVSVRDQQSLENWRGLFPSIKPRIIRDPAILAKNCYGPILRNTARVRKLVWLGVADMENMTQHSDQGTKVVCGTVEDYKKTIQTIFYAGYDIVLFTNGGDDTYLQKIAAFLENEDPELFNRISIAKKPVKPFELVCQIAQADIVIAHRLHANILAYAYGVPSIGLGWDQKLASFFMASNREQYLIRDEVMASHLLSMVAELTSDSISSSRALIEEAQNGSDVLTDALLAIGKK